MLAVGVRRQRQIAVRERIQHMLHGRLERRALASIHLMAQQHGKVRHLIEYGAELRAAAIVHHDGQKISVLPKFLQQLQHVLSGLVGRYNQRRPQ